MFQHILNNFHFGDPLLLMYLIIHKFKWRVTMLISILVFTWNTAVNEVNFEGLGKRNIFFGNFELIGIIISTVVYGFLKIIRLVTDNYWRVVISKGIDKPDKLLKISMYLPGPMSFNEYCTSSTHWIQDNIARLQVACKSHDFYLNIDRCTYMNCLDHTIIPWFHPERKESMQLLISIQTFSRNFSAIKAFWNIILYLYTSIHVATFLFSRINQKQVMYSLCNW